MKHYCKYILLLIIPFVLGTEACNRFLDVVPDKVATIDESFKTKEKARKYLYTLYSYLPHFNAVQGNGAVPGILGSHEIFVRKYLHLGQIPGTYIAYGQQNTNNPYYNTWEGRNGSYNLYQAIRKCNIFLKNINEVVSVGDRFSIGSGSEDFKAQWTAEAKVLKAYFYFLLTRKYGTVILNKENVPVSAPDDKLKTYRAPIDSTFNYIKQLLDEAIRSNALPPVIMDLGQNYGRITRTIAYAIKAQVALYRASPEFNGNDLYKNYLNKKGESILYTAYNPALWDSAAAAAKQAIDYATENGFQLVNAFSPPAAAGDIGDTLTRRMILRTSFSYGGTNKNPEVIWPYTGAGQGHLQQMCLLYQLGKSGVGGSNYLQNASVPLHIAEMFYTNHGLPLKEDKTRNYNNRFNLKKSGTENRFNITEGDTTVELNFGREPRFYADLTFDCSIIYGNGYYSGGLNKYAHINLKFQQGGNTDYGAYYDPPFANRYGSTGYLVKKWLNWQTEISKTAYGAITHSYFWPIIRLSELYLWYAEAKNEAAGPGPEVYEYLNKVRERAGIPGIQTAWETWAKDPDKYKSKEGLREIIHRELLIETAFEGKRFWHTRRWLTAQEEMNIPVERFNVLEGSTPLYYKVNTQFNDKFFSLKDYLWPLSIEALNTNHKLQQNPGW